MANDKDQTPKVKFISARIVVKYPRLIKPDTGTKKHPAKVPNYNVTGVFNPATVGSFTQGKTAVSYEDLVAQLEEIRDAEFDFHKADLTKKKTPAAQKLLKLLNKVPVFRPEINGDDGTETGEVSFRAKTAAEFKDRDDPKQMVKVPPPPVFDSKGKTLAVVPPIGGGSEMKIGAVGKAYYVEATGAVGVSFYLEATQLLKLVKYSGRTAESLGFGAEDDGYVDDGSEAAAAGFTEDAPANGEGSSAKAADEF